MRTSALGLVVLGLATVTACSGSSGPGSGFGSSGGGSSGGSNGSSGGNGSSSGTGASSSSGTTNLGASSSGTSSGGTIDGGFVCAPNPLNYDIPGNNCDDDDDGKIDNRITCDTGGVPSGLSAAGTAADFAAAIELCHVADATHWGVVSATYTNGHTQTGPGPDQFGQQHGVLTTFGTVVVPREGAALAALSSGSATAEDSDFIADGQDATGAFKGDKNGMQNASTCGSNPLSCIGANGNSGDVPSGFPKAATGCPNSNTVNDVIDVQLKIKVPINANGVTFDFNFFSGEWPDYVCSQYNDSFIAYLQSSAFNGGTPNNISFDANSNPISVNNSLFGVCTPNVQTGCDGTTTGTSVCGSGPNELSGTGFLNSGTWCADTSTGGGATGWLTSAAPVKPGETISLEFIIWDTGDWNYDSSVLIDDLFWQPQAINTPITQPSPPTPQ
jgi:hypothetical protein